MKNKLNILRRYIRETIDLGNVQFDPNRIDKEEIVREPNTPEEQNLFDELRIRVIAGGSIPDDAAKNISDLIKSDKYGVKGSGFFRGPEDTSKPLMRGHAFDEAWVRKNLSISIEDIPHTMRPRGTRVKSWQPQPFWKTFNKGPNTSFKTPYTFGPGPGEGFRGWTDVKMVAENFAVKYAKKILQEIDGDAYPVIFFMYPEDNEEDALLDFKASVYKLDVGRGFGHESEVMNVKPVVCRAAFVARISR